MTFAAILWVAAMLVAGCGRTNERPTLDVTDYDTFAAARQQISTDFGEIAVVENGNGPAAVFLHGFPLNGFHWRHQLTELADVRRCIAIDLMGLGHTEIEPGQSLSFSAQADMVLQTLQAMGVEEFDLVANDTGGGVAQLVVAKAPQAVRSLVLTNSDIHDNFPPEALGVVHAAATSGILDDILTNYAANPDAAREGLGALVYENPADLTDELVEVYLKPITATDARRAEINRYITSQDNAETVAIEPDLQAFDAPTLVLWATADPFFGVEWAYWLRDTIPGVREVIEIADARLFFAEERPDEVTAHIRAHWEAASRKATRRMRQR